VLSNGIRLIKLFNVGLFGGDFLKGYLSLPRQLSRLVHLASPTNLPKQPESSKLTQKKFTGSLDRE